MIITKGEHRYFYALSGTSDAYVSGYIVNPLEMNLLVWVNIIGAHTAVNKTLGDTYMGRNVAYMNIDPVFVYGDYYEGTHSLSYSTPMGAPRLNLTARTMPKDYYTARRVLDKRTTAMEVYHKDFADKGKSPYFIIPFPDNSFELNYESSEAIDWTSFGNAIFRYATVPSSLFLNAQGHWNGEILRRVYFSSLLSADVDKIHNPLQADGYFGGRRFLAGMLIISDQLRVKLDALLVRAYSAVKR